MAVCTRCLNRLEPGTEHTCPGPTYEDIQISRVRGRGIVIDTAPQHTKIPPSVLAQQGAAIAFMYGGIINLADQVAYRITGWDPADDTLTLELLEDWRATPPGDTREQLPAHLLALIDVPTYTSTACELAALLEAAIPARRAAPYADELAHWIGRLRDRCRINNKFTGRLCTHPESST